MLDKYKYKTELHSHTCPVSSCSEITPKVLVEQYKSHGYDAVTVTNHFSFCPQRERKEKIKKFLDDYYLACETGKECGIDVLFGAEIRFTENDNDYLVFGNDRIVWIRF